MQHNTAPADFRTIISLQHTATRCNTLKHAATQATHCNTCGRCSNHQSKTHHNTPQHGATRCNTLQHTATPADDAAIISLKHTTTHHNTLQHAATPCNTLQHLRTMQQSSV